DAIRDLNIAVRADVPNVVGVQVSAGPQLLRCLRIVEIPLGQPWSPRDDLARGLTVAGHLLHVGIDNAEIDQRKGEAGPGAEFNLFLAPTRKLVAFEMRHREDGARLRHAVSGVDVDTSFQRLQSEGLRQGGAAYHHS